MTTTDGDLAGGATPIELRALPRVPRAASAAALRLAVRAGGLVGACRTLDVPPLGSVALRCVDVAAAAPPEADDTVFVLSDGARRARLIIGPEAALRLASIALGVPAPRGLRPLGAAERGVVAAVVAAALRAAGARGVTVALRAPALPYPGELGRVTIALETRLFEARLLLDVPPAWLGAAPADGPGARLPAHFAAACGERDLRIPFVVELARTTLHVGELARAVPGDAVTLDAPAAGALTGAGAPRAARVTCGAFVANAAVTDTIADADITDVGARAGARAGVRLTGPFVFDEARVRLPIRRRSPTMTTSPDTDADLPNDKPPTKPSTETGGGDAKAGPPAHTTGAAAMLAAAPIEVVAELGRFTLRADEVIALGPGAVLPIALLSPTTVELRVGDRAWARGELVDVEGELGVRITELGRAPSGESTKPGPFGVDTVRYRR